METQTSSGKHMICDFQNVHNLSLLNDPRGLFAILNVICEKYNYNVLEKTSHQFSPHGVTILYLLAESHISIHTFPEKKYMAFDIYTCRPYINDSQYEWIYNYLSGVLACGSPNKVILNRSFC